MAERLKAAVLKTVDGESHPGVRIPLPPPFQLNNPEDSPFTRFNSKARKALFRAFIEARGFQARQFETEHLLLGIIGLGAEYWGDPADERSVTQLFGSYARADAIRTAVESEFPSRAPRPGPFEKSQDLPVSRAVRQVFKTCLDQADAMGHPYAGVEHLLIAIILEEESRASRVLREQGISAATVREELNRLVSSGERFDSPGPEF